MNKFQSEYATVEYVEYVEEVLIDVYEIMG